jgi:PPK2 family polyphosphate:nucleotide phosphotransferase
LPYAHLVNGRTKVALKDFDPDEHADVPKPIAEERTEALAAELADLADLLFAAGRHALLILIQGRDTSGKDGLIRHLLRAIDTQSCYVAAFKAPTENERAHDFLWRVHAQTPPRGGIAIFNRSHYEDVIAVRVHKLAPAGVWRKRFAHINTFEALLRDADTILLKFFLHISKDEQAQRLLDRQKDPTKAWKLRVDDWKERDLWDATTTAYEDALNRCSSPQAPWHIVPANNKWFRNLAVTECVVDALRPYRAGWLDHLATLSAERTREIRAYQQAQGLPTP